MQPGEEMMARVNTMMGPSVYPCSLLLQLYKDGFQAAPMFFSLALIEDDVFVHDETNYLTSKLAAHPEIASVMAVPWLNLWI